MRPWQHSAWPQCENRRGPAKRLPEREKQRGLRPACRGRAFCKPGGVCGQRGRTGYCQTPRRMSVPGLLSPRTKGWCFETQKCVVSKRHRLKVHALSEGSKGEPIQRLSLGFWCCRPSSAPLGLEVQHPSLWSSQGVLPVGLHLVPSVYA